MVTLHACMKDHPSLFSQLPVHAAPSARFRPFRTAVWTENKAQLIARYLLYFVYVTKHGTYIDGFAAPKQPDKPESWAAELVLNNEPKWMREFFLCEMKEGRAKYLHELRDRQSRKPKRRIEVLEGDFNKKVQDILLSGVITENKAAFCLLDQFTCQCEWSTLISLAKHKQEGNKIELFYFLATGWVDRALKGFSRNPQIPERWWGKPNWRTLINMNGYQRAQLFCDRFKSELGYIYADAYPIYKRGGGGRVMFHMIHATDHPEAPVLMQRAYRTVTKRPETAEQLAMEFGT
ncbi:three-Cys-motif partner protein TcmP [Rhizobium binae]|uniref:three-Cys-motif partner protein TcmP n=1 Tax=Rhizobium binae TaxID=1138190 RepID=UPI001C82A06D|nr:three-Cys-motif partner protein TcmP [Rhizobium binae]MBX4937293.1 three-Cys-motif partner protein TcmP [Rhizobium binae]MBX4943373.1 three-Cys-motif partner protein TcmP [Rhizobium binae]MBX4960022.1 three-Cys-motif partner protein TcmP [Rhizobium binae]MBX4979253.1 three-Cys-motif partner protein TcmP [Rhizobium binae]